ncbi:hypothetical protein Tco_1069515 [Tanacetum coccineum]|uniref:Uncharacterized protein n=1 Tax=Tanacetum coccineum TaxID=301880 RepID=A0ABQ5HIR9_9ASTR
MRGEHPAPPTLSHHLYTVLLAKDVYSESTPITMFAMRQIARLLAIPSPPPLPLSPWSSPTTLRFPSHHLPVIITRPVSPPPLPTSPTYLLGYRVTMIWQRAESPSTSHSLLLPPPIILSHTRASVAMMRVVALSTYILASRSETPLSGTPPLLPIPLPSLSPPLLLPSSLRYEVSKSSSVPIARPTRGLRADYGFFGTLNDEIRRDPEKDVSYGITDTWDELLVGMPGAPATDDIKSGQQLTDFVTMVRQDTDEIYRRLDNAQDDTSLMSGRFNMLFRDRGAHARTALLMEREARLSYGDCSLASSRSRSTGTACGDTETDEYTADTCNSTAGTSTARDTRGGR